MGNLTDITYGYDIAGWDGSTVPSDANHAIARMNVQPGKLYSFTGQMTGAEYCRVAFYDVGGSKLSFAVNPNNALPFYFTTPTGCTFILIAVMNDGNNTISTMSIDEVLQNPGSIKPLKILGDSNVALDLFPQVLRDAGILCEVTGFPGSTITRGFKNPDRNEYLPCIVDEALKCNPDNYSGVIICGAYNDFGYNKKNGYATNGIETGNAGSGEGTFCGDFRKLLQHFAGIPRLVNTPYRRRDDNEVFASLNGIMKGMCFIEGVPYIDGYQWFWSKEDAAWYLVDAVHHNGYGGNVQGQFNLAGYNMFIKPYIA